MAKVLHESLVEVLREQPEVLVELLRRVREGSVPGYDRVESVSADLGSALPRELRADSSLRCTDKSGASVLTIVLEVQLSIDADKAFTWPAYLTGARLRDRCPAVVVVIAIDRTVATWARKVIHLGPGSLVQPVVVGPDELTPMSDFEEARRAPGLAVVTALAHGKDEDDAAVVQFATVAARVALGVPGDRGVGYYDLVLASLSEERRTAVEKMLGNYQLQDEGLRKAWAGGKTEGKAEGRAEAILAVLDARGLPVSDAQRARIVASTDVAELDRWLRAAATATTTEQALEQT